MPRAAIYARYSTDLQSDRSIEDQFALCRSYAEREGLVVTETFEDRAKSGASVFGRDGLMGLVAAAREGRFDVLIVEHSDRIARSMRDLADIHERFQFLGIQIRAVQSGGEMNTAMIGLFGLVGQMQREDGAKKVHRGMAGVIRDGRHAGGLAYGYRPVPGKPGELAIEAAEADVVREIFDRYVAGWVPRQIAADLNARGVPPPRGRYWSAVTINGNRKRGSGMILNPLYAGRIIWNRLKMVKDPDTGRRVSRPNPESAWQTAEAPHLRIIDQGLWDAAQAVKCLRSHGAVTQTRAPKRLLSGLLRCGVCGGGMSIKDRDHGRIRIICTGSKETGVCDNRRPYYLDGIEAAVVAGLRDKLADKEAIKLYLRAYNEERRRLAADVIGRRDKLERRLAAVERERKRGLDAYMKEAIDGPEIEETLRKLLVESKSIRAELDAADKPPRIVELHPTATADYLAAIERLDATLQLDRDGGDETSTQALRALVEHVTVYPPENGDPVAIDVVGHLAKLIGGKPFPHMRMSGGIDGSGGGI